MNINTYQALAARTINKNLETDAQALHALHGMSAEVGEIHSLFQKFYQGHEIDDNDLKKEIGDLLWMIAEFCTVQNWPMEEICKMNIEKLKCRYPDGFSAERSVNRTE